MVYGYQEPWITGGSPWRLATTPVFAWSLAGTAGQFVSDKCQLCPSLGWGLTQPLPPKGLYYSWKWKLETESGEASTS